jgi:anaphase-promoting complex subunit 4
VWDLSSPESVRPFVQHVFPKENLFVPVALGINGRKDRRALLVLAEDLKHYRIFDLDFSDAEQAANEDTTMAEV